MEAVLASEVLGLKNSRNWIMSKITGLFILTKP
jgi:hypothetical protein